jgi:hypothetical protein
VPYLIPCEGLHQLHQLLTGAQEGVCRAMACDAHMGDTGCCCCAAPREPALRFYRVNSSHVMQSRNHTEQGLCHV